MGIFKKKSKLKDESSETGPGAIHSNASSSDPHDPHGLGSKTSNSSYSSGKKSARSTSSTKRSFMGRSSKLGKSHSSGAGEPPALTASSGSSSGQPSPKQVEASAPPEIPMEDVVPTMDMVPALLHELSTAHMTSDERAARALRHLFSLSEHSNDESNRNREELVHNAANGKLVPILLSFLRRCPRGSHEQYLALLVLNNISIPAENKRVIAIDCGGAAVLSRLLCQDPSCHLMVIVLVNLTFADSELRRELVNPNYSVQLVDALAYAFRVSNLSLEEAQSLNLPHLNEETPTSQDDVPRSPRQHLGTLTSNIDAHGFGYQRFDPAKLLYPETGRWCLCAMKNLTRPSGDPTAAHSLMDTGIIPLILNTIGVHDGEGGMGQDGVKSSENEINVPAMWEANSMQDAALFTLINLAQTPDARTYLREDGAVRTLAQISSYYAAGPGSPGFDPQKGMSEEETLQQQQFQCLKARMAAAYLAGGEGHFGQPRLRGTSTGSRDTTMEHYHQVLETSSEEALQITQLLSDTLHQRSREGPGGYSAATFTVKGILFAMRCLLATQKNQVTFQNVCGVKLNSLLLKALALHAIQRDLTVDTDAAEHACFSLYLMSNLGFKQPFLPSSYKEGDSIVEKVFSSYLHIEDITPPGRHAADQILLRSEYLQYEPNTPSEEDYMFDDRLTTALQGIVVEKRPAGTKPQEEIFDRVIWRSRGPKKADQQPPWDNMERVTEFPSALYAVQPLSFASTKVRHTDAIDDVAIANNIASSASGLQAESYNYWWSWKDAAPQLQQKVAQLNSKGIQSNADAKKPPNGQGTGLGGFFRRKMDNDDGPFSIFGLKCGAMACADSR